MNNMEKHHATDRILMSSVLILVMMGVLMVYSSSTFWGAERHGNAMVFMKNHLIRVGLGVLFMIMLTRLDYHNFRFMTLLFFILGFVLLIFVLALPKFHGSHRSMLIIGIRFQPSEFIKLISILYFASLFTKIDVSKQEHQNKILIHYLVLLCLTGLIFIEPDLGSALVLLFIGFSMFFIAGVPGGTLMKMVWGIIPVVSMGMILYPYQRKRLMDFFNVLFKNGELDYQIKQSMIGLANGGLAGVGYGEGKQKLLFLPEPFSDFILASLGEELGFIGLFIVFLLLGIILWRGIRIACRAQDRYGFLIAGGITSMILINALINAGVVLHLLPTTGLTFPFLSYGGSSLTVQMIGVGILLNISRKSVVSYQEFTDLRSHQYKRKYIG